MAKNIELMGAVFPDVPSIKLPQYGGGLVSFDDTSDADAVAGDIAQGKTAYVNGVKVVGTNQGGGGAEVFPFYHKQLDIPNTTSTTAVDIEEVSLPQGWNDDEHLLYFISEYVGDVPSNHYIGSEVTGVHAVFTVDSFSLSGAIKRKNTNGQISYGSSSTVGVFPRMSSGKLYVRYAYSANATYAIGGTYDVKIYLMPKSILKS